MTAFTTHTEANSTIRVGLVQWLIQSFPGPDAFLKKTEVEVRALANQKADFIVFPEYFTLSLLEHFHFQNEPKNLRTLASLADHFKEHFIELAQEYNVNIIAGSIPALLEDGLSNCTYLCRRDGSTETYTKLHLSPFEIKTWQMSAGSQLGIFDTDCGKIGIQLSYDIQFPELSRIYAEKGVQVLFVPFATDSQQAYQRVRACGQARAIENECFVALSGCVGNFPEVNAVGHQYAQSVIFTPTDYWFPGNGIQTEATANIAAVVLSDLDIQALERLHHQGNVQNLKDRRKDFYQAQEMTISIPENGSKAIVS